MMADIGLLFLKAPLIRSRRKPPVLKGVAMAEVPRTCILSNGQQEAIPLVA